MISKVYLENWKRHESLECSFHPGLNFIFGPNGRGKTSLMQGVKFALLGDLASTRSEFIRHGEESASARVILGDQATMIGHALDRDGQVSSSLSLPGSKESLTTAHEFLSQEMGADVLFLRNILFLFEGETVRYESDPSLNIEEQLQTLLPLDQLERARRSAIAARKPLSKTLKTQRLTLKTSREDQAVLERGIEEAKTRLAELEQTEKESLARWTHAKAELEKATGASERRHLADQWARKWEQFLPSLLLSVDELEVRRSPLEAIQGKVRTVEGEFRSAILEQAETKAKISQVEKAIDELQGASGDCPLCRQALTDEHRHKVVRDLQEDRLRALQPNETGLSRMRDLEAQLEKLHSLAEQCQGLLATKPAQVEEVPDMAALQTTTEDAEQALLSARSQTDKTREDLASSQERLRIVRENLALEQEVVRAYRQDMLLETVELGLSNFSKKLRRGIITPISDELRNQWKAFRPDAEWALSVDMNGSLCIQREDHTLPYSCMSGGEKMLSLLLFRLALIGALTKADFILLDEPLEHLDPRSRRLMISTLHQVAKSGLIPQIIVSTYEESLARRLISRSQAHAIYL